MANSSISDREMNNLFGQLGMYVRRKVVAALLVGNDTQCFSTDQYKAEYERQQPMPKPYGRSASYWQLDPEMDLARRHLLSVPELVREVRSDVWAAVR
jgi:hypothetical protein